MFKIFLRKRFVCGYTHLVDTAGIEHPFYVPKQKWICSFDDKIYVLKWMNYMQNPILYDRQIKIFCDGKNNIKKYLGEQDSSELKERDIMILEILRDNPGVSLVSIAKKMSLSSPGNIHQHLQKLLKMKYVKKMGCKYYEL